MESAPPGKWHSFTGAYQDLGPMQEGRVYVFEGLLVPHSWRTDRTFYKISFVNGDDGNAELAAIT